MHVVEAYITTVIYYSIFVQFAVVMTNKKRFIYNDVSVLCRSIGHNYVVV